MTKMGQNKERKYFYKQAIRAFEFHNERFHTWTNFYDIPLKKQTTVLSLVFTEAISKRFLAFSQNALYTIVRPAVSIVNSSPIVSFNVACHQLVNT
jgi:hypothetical protein